MNHIIWTIWYWRTILIFQQLFCIPDLANGHAKYFSHLGLLWLILKQLAKRFMLKTVCMWWFMFRKLSPILRLSHRFLSTENFHYGCTFIKDYKYYFYNMPEWNVRYNQFHMQHILYLYLVHVVHCRQGVQGFTIWIRFYDK